jgi:hypothetical protein
VPGKKDGTLRTMESVTSVCVCVPFSNIP